MAMGNSEDRPLDNVVWTALTTVHASIALGDGLARHYPRDMAPFSAVAGERFRFPGYVELSAICVRPDARKRGLGRTLTQYLMQRAFERGEIPFLHVFPENPATTLYAELGFRERTRLWVIRRRPAPTI